MRYVFFIACLAGTVLTYPAFHAAHSIFYVAAFVILFVLSALGVWDLVQTRHGVRDRVATCERHSGRNVSG